MDLILLFHMGLTKVDLPIWCFVLPPSHVSKGFDSGDQARLRAMLVNDEIKKRLAKSLGMVLEQRGHKRVGPAAEGDDRDHTVNTIS
jgi:hypothetical protein